MKKMILILSSILTLAGCKEEGIGGDASIRGYVHVKKYNSTFTQFIGEYPGKDVYVYIIFGDHIGYDKRIKTDFQGNFEFRYLYTGNYKVYVYSKDSTLMDPSGIVSVVRDVTINDRTEVVNLDTLLIFE